MKRSKFSLSTYKLLSCDMGELVPIALTEVLPGDTIQQATSLLLRVSPLLAPVMHPVHVRIHHWFVPHRLVWEDWEDFITGGPDGMNASVFPTIDAGAGFAEGSLADYLGCPLGVSGLDVSALPFRGYAMIWNEWYRDQDLQTALTIDLTSGPDTTTNTVLQNVAWEKDYFTTARPWAQKGPSVTIPLEGTAPVSGIGPFTNTGWTAGPVAVYETETGLGSFASYKNANGTGNDNTLLIEQDASTGNPKILAELGLADNLASINDLRTAFAIQRYEEARARYGSRYTEYLRYLGVKSSDARLQRPEYLGGGKQTIQFSEVLQTADNVVEDEVVDAVGTLRGHGIASMKSNRYRRFFEEHGYVFSFVSVRPKTLYVQGLNRTWNRRTKEDFFQRELQDIGQQEIKYKEVYAAHATPEATFGYQDRYDEYRRSDGANVAGQFRDSLDFWHYARIFASDPALNADFVKSVPTKRTNAVQNEDVLWIMANHSIQARRLVKASGGNSGVY